MNTASTFYFSEIAGKRIIGPDGNVIGRLKDLIADRSSVHSDIIAAQIEAGGNKQIVDFRTFHITRQNKGIELSCSELRPYSLEGVNVIFFANNVLDRQIVDINGRKLVRVNDIHFATKSGVTFVVAADVGFEGILRRLSVSGFIAKLVKPFKATLPGHLILWDDVETIGLGHSGIKLNKETTNLNRLHPSDLADILEDLDRNTRIEVFSSLDSEKAADVLEEMERDVRENLLESIPIEKIADLLEIMPADEAADILDEVTEAKAEEILNEMEEEASHEVRELMEYEANEVGSLMTTDFVSFRDHNTVDDTLRKLREVKPESDMIYYLYIVSDDGKLEGIVSLRDIVVAQPDTVLKNIMKSDMVFVRDEDEIDSLGEIVSKYNLLAVPVVDANNLLLGMVIINDIMYTLLRRKRKRM